MNAERAIGESEKMMDLLLQWGQERPEVRFFLRQGRSPNLLTGERHIRPVLQSDALTVAFPAVEVQERTAIFTSVAD